MAAATKALKDKLPVLGLAPTTQAGGLKVEALTEADKGEALNFLAARPVHTVCMSGFIRDNGVVSPKNRGTFYGCRNHSGELKGVALIGHATLFETQNDEALQAFACLKNQIQTAHLVRGEHDTISKFMHHYRQFGHEPRLACREILFVRTSTVEEEVVPQLRNATLNELEALKQLNAEFIKAECGIDPLKRDPVGFASRLASRIEKKRVWVWEHEGEIIFKADVFAQTPQVAYLEGVFVNPEYRNRGIGVRCMRDLSQRLLKNSESLCLLINEQREQLENFYIKAGYERRGVYDTLYLSPEN